MLDDKLDHIWFLASACWLGARLARLYSVHKVSQRF